MNEKEKEYDSCKNCGIVLLSDNDLIIEAHTGRAYCRYCGDFVKIIKGLN